MKKIKLTQGQEVIVDDKWFEILNKWKWRYQGGYAARRVGSRKSNKEVYMHRFITMAPDEYQVDHINQNKLDNREENLRVVSPKKNYFNRKMLSNNTTGYKGVCYDKSRNKFIATISANKKHYNLGRFKTAVEAAKAYNNAAIELHGEFAHLNVL